MHKNFSSLILRTLSVILALSSVMIFAGCNPVSVYNTAIQQEEGVNEAWAQVQNVYQRRLDLIPNLVSSVRGYAKHEKETLENVMKMRSQATSFQITKEVLEDPVAFKKFQSMQGEISGVLSRLMMVTENYPQLRATENFQTLMAQLEGTENRIAVERKRYNEVVKNYNIYIRQLPNNLAISWFFGGKFKEEQMFEASPDAQKAPTVNFE